MEQPTAEPTPAMGWVRRNMDLDFTDEQNMLRASLRGICESVSDSQAIRRAESDPTAPVTEVWRALAEGGFLGLGIDEAHGGSALGMIESAIAYHELGRSLVPGPHFESAVLAARLIARAGTADQASRWLPSLADGSVVIAPAWYEPGSTDDLSTVTLGLRRTDAGFTLSGRKTLVAHAGTADRLLVLVAHPVTRGSHALACIDAQSPGVTRSAEANLAGAPLYTVDFDAVPVSVDDMLGDGRPIEDVWRAVFVECLIPLAAQAVGGAERVLEMSVAYAKERQQFGRPIGGFQSIAHYLADAATELEAAQVLVWQAAWAHAEALPFERLALTAKLFGCRAFRRISALAIQVHGGLGFTTEADPQLYFRRAKHQQLVHGDSAWLETRLAECAIAGDVPQLN